MIRLLLALFPAAVFASSVADSAIIPYIRGPHLDRASILDRVPVSDDLELVLARANVIEPRTDYIAIGLFLQKRNDPNVVYRLTVETGFNCDIRVERVTATDTVLSCTPEKGPFGPLHKFIYDIRAKALLNHIEYSPFGVSRAFPGKSSIGFISPNQQRPIAFNFKEERTPAFQILDRATAAEWVYRAERSPQSISFGPGNRFILKREGTGEGSTLVVSESTGKKRIPHYLPQTTYDEFAKARPERVQNGYQREGTELIEQIGPWQLEGDRLWFGKSFYDGEGDTGVGSFGYFDPLKRSYQLYSPPEIRNFSISAMLVEPDAIWLGLVNNGEWGSTGAGVVRFDRKMETVQKFEIPNITSDISRFGNRLFLTNEFGVTVIEDGKIQRYFVDQLSDGRLRIAEAR